MDLNESWNNLTTYQNGEAVGRRMAQLLELALRPEYEHLYPSILTIWREIENREEQLLGRTFDEIRKDGRITQNFETAMRAASDEEWKTFRENIKLETITNNESTRIIADGSGLVRNTGFEDWVLGKTERPIDPETIINKIKTLGKES